MVDVGVAGCEVEVVDSSQLRAQAAVGRNPTRCPPPSGAHTAGTRTTQLFRRSDVYERAAPRGPMCSIDVRVERGTGDVLLLGWRLDAELAQLCIPSTTGSARSDGLWQHTCFEAFLMQPPSPAYIELNFSPSGAWAAYRFMGYRDGMTPLVSPWAPEAVWRRDRDDLGADYV